MDEISYPNFRQEVIDVSSGGSPHWIDSFQFHVKGKRRDDVVVFGLGQQARPSEVLLYENPRNLEFDEGIEDDSILTQWNRLDLHALKQPSSCISVDITGNGLNDLIVTCEYGDSHDAMNPYGGRICWLENFGTNEGDWSCHEIGRFPGVNCVKVGHFSTTYSLQLLAIVKSSRIDAFSPLIIFTRPPNVYKSRHWLVATALEDAFSAIQDCIVIPSSGGALDNILISSKEGLSIAWYHGRSWKHNSLSCANLPNDYLPGRLCAGKVGRDPVAFIVCSEAKGGARLSIFSKDTAPSKRYEFRDANWTFLMIDDFAVEHDATILDVLCEDCDEDGVDEILVSVLSKGPDSGVYCFLYDGCCFKKHKLCDEPAAKLTSGHFAVKNRIDIAMLTCAPCKAMVLYHSLVSSQIKPSIEDSELVFCIPRLASSTCDIDVIDLSGYTISLVILPPNAPFEVALDGSEAVKVLHGLLGWIDSQSEIIERTRVACGPGCVTPMLVDSPEGHVRSGDDGAVFVRMRPSTATGTMSLRALNALPSYFPCDVCAFQFSWQRAGQQWHRRSAGSDALDNLYHLSGFRVRFDTSVPTVTDTDKQDNVSYVHFWAAAPGSSTGFVKDIHPSMTPDIQYNQHNANPRKAAVCSIRASLSNPSGEAGLVYCGDPLDRGTTPPTSHQLARARKMILPVMYEHGPFWHSVKTVGEDGEGLVGVEYPWHAWVTGRANQRQRRSGRTKWNIWAVFDFPNIEEAQLPQDDVRSCIIC